MNEVWWEKQICFLCNFWWLVLGAITIGLTLLFTRNYWLPMIIPEWGATPVPVESARVENFENLYLTPVTFYPAIVGTSVPIESVADDWQTYINPVIGIRLRYPNRWKLLENEDKDRFSLIPPDTNVNLPSPSISFRFIPDRAFNESTPILADRTGYQPITVNTFSGMEYQDDRLSIPGQNSYIEFNHNQGTLMISATMGPIISLVPQMREILRTLENIS